MVTSIFPRQISRRRFLRLAGLGSAGAFLAACNTQSPTPMMGAPGMMMGGANATASAPMAGATRAPSAGFRPDVEIDLRATPADIALRDGKPTPVWMYTATAMKGDASVARALPNSYLGPILRVSNGQRLRVNFTNQLPSGEETIVHWHGLHTPEDMDGHPRFAVAPGHSYAYEFEVGDGARTAWFHPHPHGKTAAQVYNGLAGLFIVSDDAEKKLGLPSGEFDVPLVLQDRTFDSSNRLVYFGQGMMGGAMQSLMGFLGETPVVNGRPNFTLGVASRAYRLRLVNGSNARIFKLAWSDGSPMTVIATDGGLLEKPVARNYVMLAPGERVEVWADFGGRKVGDEVWLESQAFFGAEDPAEEMSRMMGGAGMGAMMNPGNPDALGAPMKLARVRIERAVGDSPKLPATLAKLNRYALDDAINKDKPRAFVLTQRNMRWTINGREWEGNVAASDETVKLNTTEVWDVSNATSPGEMMHRMGMAHPFHVHGAQFMVLKRQLDAPELKPGYDSVRDGYVDDGWKDTIMLMPGERATLLMRFSKYAGLFAYHCHNLEHSDMGMMRNYEVRA